MPNAPPAEAAAPATGRSAKARLLGPGGMLALGAGLLVLVAIVAASLGLAVLNRHRLARISASQETRSLIAAISHDLLDAESAQRGFVLTGRETYLAPYHSAVASLPGRLGALADRLGASPAGSRLIPELRRVVGDKLDELRRTVALQRAGQHAEAIALINTDIGHAAMTRIDGLIARMAAEQRSVLLRQTAASQRSAVLLVGVDAAGFLCLLLLAFLVGRAIRATILALQSAEAALADANAELGRANERLHEEVVAQTADLTAANEEMQRFAYIVSHDLRSPLVNIMGFTGELETITGELRDWLDTRPAEAAASMPVDLGAALREEAPEAIRFISASTAKMDRLISAILRLSREGRRVLRPELLDMSALVASVADTFGHQVQAQGASVEVETLPEVVGDRLAMEQVFANLIENALKYHAPSRPCRVRVSGEASGSRAVFVVADNGRGIASRDRERVFELFRRAGDQNVPGEGIGLSHVRSLVRHLGGSISCVSELDAGSTFRVELPLVILPRAPQRAPGPPQSLEGPVG